MSHLTTRTPVRHPQLATSAGRLLTVLALASLAGLVLLALRVLYGGTSGYRSLPWDLFLAWLPVPLAAATLHSIGAPATAPPNADLVRTPGTRPAAPAVRRLKPRTLVLAASWLLFFPNAPYLVTQFMHLHPTYGVAEHPLPAILGQFTFGRPVPLWFDVLMLSTFAWTGLMLGFASLHLIHRALARLLPPAAGWLVVVAGLGLCAFGISLGRFQRWNSWDVLTQPHALFPDVLSRMFHPLAYPRTTATTLGFAAFLLLAYLSLIALIRLGMAGDASARGSASESSTTLGQPQSR